MGIETQVITAALDEVVKVCEAITPLVDGSQTYEPDPGSMQRSSNTYWKPIEQNARVVDGTDLTGVDPDGMLELSISGNVGDYSNIWRTIDSKKMRDDRTLRRSMAAGARALIEDMERKGLQKAATHGAFCTTFSGAPGPGVTQTKVWTALAESEARMFDAQMATSSGTSSFLNAQTWTGGGEFLTNSSANFANSIPDEAYRQGEIQRQIAGIGQVNRHNKLINIEEAKGSCTVSSNLSFRPLATEPAPNNTELSVDHRFATIGVSDTTDVKVGDKFTFPDVKALNMGNDKQVLDYDQTFTVAQVKDGTNLVISPKPIWVDDPNLDGVEKAYANIASEVTSGTALNFLNTNTTRSNIIMANDALVLASQPITVGNDIFQGLDAEPFEAGPIRGMLGFESNLVTGFTGRYRMAIWYDWEVEKPEAIGTILFNQ